MKAIKFGLAGTILLCFLIWLPNTASARTRFYMSFGTDGIYDYPGSSFHSGCYPHYRRYRDGYNWLDRGRYIWLDRARYRWLDRDRYRGPRYCHRWRPHQRYNHLRATIILGEGDWYYHRREPGYYIIDPPPLIIEKRVKAPPVIIQPKKYDKETEKLFKRLRQNKSEFLKKLKDRNSEQRREAIDKLGGFSFDIQVKKALEKILLSDSDPALRMEVAKLLGKVKNRKVLPALEKARKEDSNEEVRKEAGKAIKKIKGY